MCVIVFFFKQKTAYEMRISDWGSDVCSSDLADRRQRLFLRSARSAADQDAVGPATDAAQRHLHQDQFHRRELHDPWHRRPVRRHDLRQRDRDPPQWRPAVLDPRSEEHTSELQSLMRLSYAVFCLKKKTQKNTQ